MAPRSRSGRCASDARWRLCKHDRANGCKPATLRPITESMAHLRGSYGLTGLGPRNTRQVTRAVSAVLVAVLLALAALAVSSAYSGERSSDRLKRSGDLVEAYFSLNRAFAAQEHIEGDYDDEPGPDARAQFDAATADIAAALTFLDREGTLRDRNVAATVAALHERYARGNHAAFDAIDAGHMRRAEAIDDTVIDSAGTALQLQVSQFGAATRRWPCVSSTNASAPATLR